MRVAIYVFDGISMFHIAAPQLVFTEAAALSAESGRWQVRLWSTGAGPVMLAGGHALAGVDGPEALDDADLVIIPSWPADAPALSDELARLLHHAHDRGARIAGLCLGAIPVAESGLLKGRAAVTHWAAADRLATRTGVDALDTSVLYIDHGDVLTSAGTASSIDACLHLVRASAGTDLANRVARHIVVAPHRDGGQAQYIERPIDTLSHDGRGIGDVMAWALANLHAELTVATLAERANTSRRSLIRHFHATTGTSPARWILQQRLHRARELLETTDWPLSLIANRCGFGSTVTFRQNFTTHFSLTPSSYRHQFAPTSTAGR